MRLAVEAGLFPAGTTYFDYGCGHGADIEYVQRLGLPSSGWAPYFRPNVSHTSADVVNIGYVITVIEDTAERREALLNAWNLAQRVLIVAAQVLIDDCTRGVIAYGDGIITSRNTFQKYFEQEELKAYIDLMLMSLGQTSLIEERCRQSPIGWATGGSDGGEVPRSEATDHFKEPSDKILMFRYFVDYTSLCTGSGHRVR